MDQFSSNLDGSDNHQHQHDDNEFLSDNVDLTSDRFLSSLTTDPSSAAVAASAAAAAAALPIHDDNDMLEESDTIYRSIGPIGVAGRAPSSSSAFWDHAQQPAQHNAKELGGSFSTLSLHPHTNNKSLETVKTIELGDASSFIRQLSSSSSSSSTAPAPTDVPLSQALPPLSAFSSNSPVHQLQHARALPQPAVLESSHVVLSHAPADVFSKILAVFASYNIERNRTSLSADDVADDADDAADGVADISISHDVAIVKLVAAKYKVKAAVVPCARFAACTFQCQLFTHASSTSTSPMCVVEFQRRRGCPFTFHSVFQQLIRIIDTKTENAVTAAPFTRADARATFCPLDVASLNSSSATDENLMAMSTSDKHDVALEGMQALARANSADVEAAATTSTVTSSSPAKEQQCLDLLSKVLGNHATSAPFASCTSAQLDAVTSILATTTTSPSFQARLLEQKHAHLLHALARVLNNANISQAAQLSIVQSLRQIAQYSTTHASSLIRALKTAPSQYNQVIALLALFASSTKDSRLQTSARAALRSMQQM